MLEGVWRTAKHYGIPARIVELLRNWYIGASSCVRLDGEYGDWCSIRTGLRQGCVMSPSLSYMYLGAMMRKVTEGSPGGVTVGQERVMDSDFADDVTLLADS